MTDAEPICGARGDLSRIPCQLPKGHVKTADNWHQNTSRTTQRQESAGFRTDQETTEVHSWAPRSFELDED